MTWEGGRAGNWHHVPRLGSGRSTVHGAESWGAPDLPSPCPHPRLTRAPGPRAPRRARLLQEGPAGGDEPGPQLALPRGLAHPPPTSRCRRAYGALPRPGPAASPGCFPGARTRAGGPRRRRGREGAKEEGEEEGTGGGKRRCSRGGGGSRRAGDQKKGETTQTRRPPAQTLKSASGARSPAGSDGEGPRLPPAPARLHTGPTPTAAGTTNPGGRRSLPAPSRHTGVSGAGMVPFGRGMLGVVVLQALKLGRESRPIFLSLCFVFPSMQTLLLYVNICEPAAVCKVRS